MMRGIFWIGLGIFWLKFPYIHHDTNAIAIKYRLLFPIKSSYSLLPFELLLCLRLGDTKERIEGKVESKLFNLTTYIYDEKSLSELIFHIKFYVYNLKTFKDIYSRIRACLVFGNRSRNEMAIHV